MAPGDELVETAADPAVSAGQRPLGPGDGLGRYRVLRVLGQGGMGVVYAAHDPDLDRPVALKVLRGAAGDEARTRLLREARAMAKLSHPNVITVYEVGSAGVIDFVAMELIDGTSLADWMRERRRPVDEVLRLFRAAARGLAAAHAVGLVHRDFKPANVLLGKGDRVVVTDFGLARAFDDLLVADPEALATATTQPIAVRAAGERPDAASLSSTLTRTGALLGTPAYMAPEQFAGVTAGPRSDQYAFCVALWEALTGARPFQGATVEDLRQAATTGLPVGADALPRGLRPILLRGMAREAADRYPDLSALIDALDRAERRPRSLAIAATGGAALVAALAVAALWPRGGGARAVTAPVGPCPDAAAELAAVWSPARAAQLAAHLAAAPGPHRELADGLDRVAAAWLGAQRATCAIASGPARDGQRSCLSLVRDQLAAAVAFAGEVAPAELRPAGVLDEIDDPAGCARPAAGARPALPADDEARRELSAIRTLAAGALVLDDKAAARATADRAIARARASGDPAALAEALLAGGTVARRADDYLRAEALYEEAATTAEAVAADGLRAAALVGSARCASERSSDAARVRAAIGKARAAVTRAGDPAELVANLDAATALVDASVGDFDGSLAAAVRAREGFDAVGAMRPSLTVLYVEARVRGLRDLGDDRARAGELYAEALARAARLYGEQGEITRELRQALALHLVDHEPDRAAAIFASLPAEDAAPPGAATIRGRVVGVDGRPRTGAVVHVGKRLAALADGTVIATRLDRTFAGPRRAATDVDGRFTLAALPDEILIVVAGDLRSRPVKVADVPPSIVVRPTHRARLRVPGGPGAGGSLTVAFGMSDGVVGLNYQAFATRTGAETWEVAALPEAPQLQAIALRLGRTSHEYLTRRLSTEGTADPIDIAIQQAAGGVALELIVRGDRLVGIPGATVFVIPGRELAGRTMRLADFSLRAFRAPRVFSGYARPGGPASATATGAEPTAQPDDLQLQVPGVPPGPSTVCVLPFGIDVRDPRLLEAVPDFDELDVHCKAVDIPADAATYRLVVTTPAMQRPR